MELKSYGVPKLETLPPPTQLAKLVGAVRPLALHLQYSIITHEKNSIFFDTYYKDVRQNETRLFVKDFSYVR